MFNADPDAMSGENSRSPFTPLDWEFLSRAAELMELTPDGTGVRISGLNKTYDVDELIPGTVGLDETLGRYGLLFTVVGYIFVSVIGALGNALVLFIVLSRPKMRVVRHVFIANLAFSDFILCAITTPFTLLDLMGNPIGTYGIMCKVVPALQATSVYVSTLSITAIALERYKVIVYSMNPTPSRRMIISTIVFFIWFISLALSMPFVVFRIRVQIGIPKIKVMYKCTEEWPVAYGRALYSVFCMFFQYCMPSFIIGAAHIRIVMKLRRRFVNRQDNADVTNTTTTNGHASQAEESEVLEALRGRRKRQRRRQQKTNLLLMLIAVIFALCWLPLNVVNIVADFSSEFYSEYQTLFDTTFVCAHLFAMSSAVANPILYGFLNENFREEFRQVFLFWVRFTLCGKNLAMRRRSFANGKPTETALTSRPNHERVVL